MWIRNALDQLFAPVKQTPAEAFAEVDQTHRVEPLKLSSSTRDRCDPLLTVHVTAVVGGFGIHPKHAHRRRDALLDRYARVAYHRIASRELGHIRNHALTRRTSHGHAGNRGAGWAADCGAREQLAPEFAALCLHSLVSTLTDVHTHAGEVVIVVPHRVWSRSRLADPGPIVWGLVLRAVEVVGPTVAAVGWDLVDARKGGRRIPRPWV